MFDSQREVAGRTRREFVRTFREPVLVAPSARNQKKQTVQDIQCVSNDLYMKRLAKALERDSTVGPIFVWQKDVHNRWLYQYWGDRKFVKTVIEPRAWKWIPPAEGEQEGKI